MAVSYTHLDVYKRQVRIVEPGGKDVGQRLHHFIGVARDGIQLAGLVVQMCIRDRTWGLKKADAPSSIL